MPDPSFQWKKQFGKPMSIVCHNGSVYRCTLKKEYHDHVVINDLSGRTVSLALSDMKELIIDFVTEN